MIMMMKNKTKQKAKQSKIKSVNQMEKLNEYAHIHNLNRDTKKKSFFPIFSFCVFFFLLVERKAKAVKSQENKKKLRVI